jgi:inner membrane transporter RhtA
MASGTRTPAGLDTRTGAAVPVALVLGSIVSVQLGSAVAFNLFDDVRPGGAVFLRVAFAAVVLMAVWRPSTRGHPREALRTVWLFGLALAAMNFSFYLALDRIPLGIAVTFEFAGPLGVAIAASRKPIDALWVTLAAAGIVLLSPGFSGSIDGLGVFFALLAGAWWAAYIVLAARVGREFTGGDGLALALVVSSVLLLPVGIAGGGSDLIGGGVLAAGVGLALLSSAIPYSLELEALRRLPTGTFGVLMSLEPAVAAAIGFVVLGQDLLATELVAIALVVVASAGALRSATTPAIEA